MRRHLMGKSLKVVIFVLLFVTLNCLYNSYGQDEENNYKKEFGIYSGWMDGNLKDQDDYEMVPLCLQFGFDITPSFRNNKHIGSLKFVLEPFLNSIVSPNENI